MVPFYLNRLQINLQERHHLQTNRLFYIKTDSKYHVFDIIYTIGLLVFESKLYIPSTPKNSNETHTFMCLGRTGRFGQR